MRVSAALSLSILALLVGPEPARAGPGLLIGVHDDSIKWTERPSPILGTMRALGLGGIRVTLEWRQGKRSLTGSDHDALRRAVAAHRHGVRIVLGIYGRARDAPHATERARGLLPLRPQRSGPVRRGAGRRDLERSELEDVLAAPRQRPGGLRGTPRPLLGPAARDRARRERAHDDGAEPRSGRLHS